jgi:tetratricopeptide (TPR) repeat protein
MRFFSDERFDEAAREFELATQKDPAFVDAYFYLGQAHEKQNRLRQAENAYRECIRLDSRHLKARESLGLLLYRLNRFPEAKKHLEVAVNLNSVLPEVYTNLGEIYLTERNCSRAREMFQKALVLNSGYYPAMQAMERYKAVCRTAPKKKTPSPARSKPKPQKKKTFQGGGQWLDPDEF